jgi:hypothetical protein
MKNLENSRDSGNSKLILPDWVDQPIDIESLIKKHLINYDVKEVKPFPCLEIRQEQGLKRIGTFGNFSATVGRQKSRKTFASAIFMSECIMNDIRHTFIGKCEGRTNIFFDTEQGRYDAAMNNSRIIRLCGYEKQPNNLQVHALRSLTTFERIQYIDYVIRTVKNPGFVVIDGIRDLVTSINDEAQATEITSKLMRWTEDYNCHINVILHLNKGDEGGLRGHLGTEIQNKAESIIEVEKSKEFNGYSIIKPRDMRGIDFEPIGFLINEYGLPKIDLDFEVTEPELFKAKSKIEKPNF